MFRLFRPALRLWTSSPPRGEKRGMDALIEGYRRFRSQAWPADKARYEALSAKGQAPADPGGGLFGFAGRSADRFRGGTWRDVRGAQRGGSGPALPAGRRLSRHQRRPGIRGARPQGLAPDRPWPRPVRRRRGHGSRRPRRGARLRAVVDGDRPAGPAPPRPRASPVPTPWPTTRTRWCESPSPIA